MTRTPRLLALLLVVGTCPVRAGEEELEVNFQTGRRAFEPDLLVLPQWRSEDRTAFAAGQPVNLGGGLWSEERYPLEPSGRAVAGPDSAASNDDPEFVRPVDFKALARIPSPLASAAGSVDAGGLGATTHARSPFWPWLLAAVLGLGVPTAWGTRRHHLRPRVFQFPDTEPVMRLGGPHSGGSGAVLRW